MNVLLIAPRFYDYDTKIKEEIERQGHSVDLFCEYKEKYSFFTRFVSKSKKIKNNLKIQKKILSEIKTKTYDFVLVIVGRFLSEYFMTELKEFHQKARFILYLWDDVSRCESFERINKYFDNIYSFDRKDCAEKGFEFLPLFYTKEFEPNESIEKNINVYGALFAHSDRIDIVRKVSEQVENSYFYIYFTSKIQLLKYLISEKKGKEYKQIHAKNVSMSKNVNILNMQKSKCVLDIQHPTQVGLTIRTIESIGCKNKLITTNRDVVNYDFYNKKNILVIDRNNPIVPQEFITGDYETLDKSIYEKYSIAAFVHKLLW